MYSVSASTSTPKKTASAALAGMGMQLPPCTKTYRLPATVYSAAGSMSLPSIRACFTRRSPENPSNAESSSLSTTGVGMSVLTV